ncbi:MAG: hypothetical protein L3J06_04385 [Cyclobacteriaceae bacterium]|nr:hypothetical protein [Cyclobacteriaceae bacterium]
MRLIADSGSTKTEWILFDSTRQMQTVTTAGLNPLYLSEAAFIAELEHSILADWATEVTQVWFYGAGCGTIEVKNKTQAWLSGIFINAKIEVESDLLGAARATCRTSEGIAAILGTGSNSCYYDGKNIKMHIKPLGFILGDEGSGAALGKALLKKLLRDEFSPNLSKLIYKKIGLDYHEIISKVYKEEWPNRFIASCAKALFLYKEEAEIEKILRKEFDTFALLIKKYGSTLKVNLIGSIGFYFKDFIKASLQKQGLETGLVLKSPTEALVGYHLQKKH